MSLTDSAFDDAASVPSFDAAFDAELRASLAQSLSHPVVEALRSRLDARTPVEASIAANSKLAAVVALLRITDSDSAELLFIKRAVIERDPWSGHVAFPGGRHDVADHTLADTAIRETREELSMDIARYGRLLGRLDDLAPVSPALPPIIIRPFVAVVPAALPFVLSEREVAGAFWVPVSLLRSAEAQSEFRMEREGATTRFPAYGVFGHTIWGLTERIVTQLLPLFTG
ncbi:MAG: NUDIX hydrolase [Gemmatimonas sp.]